MKDTERRFLEERVAARMSPYRFAHTKGVAGMAERLAALFCPDARETLVAAALLHDVTKELSDCEQLSLIREAGIALREDELASPKIYHGITAPLVIRRDFPEYATDSILLPVRWHTTGHRGMSLAEALLYLADYIEEGRQFSDCVALRTLFFEKDLSACSPEERLAHLRLVVCRSLEMTVEELERKGTPLCLDTVEALRFFTEEEYPL